MIESEALQTIARKIRRHIVSMTCRARSGHPGGSLSMVEILTYLYFQEMHVSSQNPADPDRDRLVLSKGHGAPALYAALALKGFFPETELMRLRQTDSILQGHPCRIETPGVDASTGSLGQGLSMAVGLALGLTMSGTRRNVYCIIGDGESQEGQIWEAATTAGFRKVSNLCVFLDYNDLQIDGKVSDIRDIRPIRDKWEAFRWHVRDIRGHNFDDIRQGIDSFKATRDRPTLLIADTVKGKGVSFMEHAVDFHGVAPTDEELEIALKELDHETR